jgi:hypothetical protein
MLGCLGWAAWLAGCHHVGHVRDSPRHSRALARDGGIGVSLCAVGEGGRVGLWLGVFVLLTVKEGRQLSRGDI